VSAVIKLVVVVVVLLVVLAGVDVATRIAMEHQLEQRIDSYAPGTDADVAIHGFPWLPKLLADGEVDKISAHANQVSQGPFVVEGVEVTVTGVRIDRHLLLDHRELEIVSIDHGIVSADMTQAELDQLAGLPVVLGNGVAQVTVEGVTVTAHVSISDGDLHVEAEGLPVSVPIPTLPILPCLAQVTVVPGNLIGPCTFQQIPPALKTALQGS